MYDRPQRDADCSSKGDWKGMENVSVQDIVLATGGVLLSGDDGVMLNKIRLDSRQVETGDLFVPIIGEKVDAHKFLEQVAEKGAGAVLTSEHKEKTEEMAETSCAWIAVDDTKKALQAVGRYLRKRLTLPIVGVTGSVGKTTTREMIAAALSARFHVYKTPGNSNSQVGVPITVSEITKEDEVGVLELGMSEPGELTVIARIAKPDVAVITNIGITHIGQLGSQENILREKLHITDGMKDGGLLILNGDDPLLKGVQGREGLRTVYYGTGENCDFRAVDICFEDGFPSFTAVHGADRQRVRLNVMGQHNVMNAMAAMAVCAECGMTMEEAARGLLTGQGFKNRQQVHETGRFTILDDSYNACPESMKAALQVFNELHPERRHVAVLAEMRELGRETESAHRQVGVFAAEAGIHLLVTLGAECRALTEEFKKRSGAPVAEFTDKDQMTAYLDQALQDGDCVLFKGANSMALFKVAARYMENRPE